MELRTLCIGAQPVLVLSTDVEPALPDVLKTDPKLLKDLREGRKQVEMLRNMLSDPEVFHVGEIYEALDTWLREDLKTLTSNGKALWSGDMKDVTIRKLTSHEMET